MQPPCPKETISFISATHLEDHCEGSTGVEALVMDSSQYKDFIVLLVTVLGVRDQTTFLSLSPRCWNYRRQKARDPPSL